jgi:hypothetical protein
VGGGVGGGGRGGGGGGGDIPRRFSPGGEYPRNIAPLLRGGESPGGRISCDTGIILIKQNQAKNIVKRPLYSLLLYSNRRRIVEAVRGTA